jgi:hypothetical protein
MLKLPNKDNLVRNLVKRHKFVQHVEKMIGEQEWNWSASFEPKPGDDGWHPSGHCTPSLHALYTEASMLMAARKDPNVQYVKAHPVSLRKTFAVGHFWHAYLQFITVASGLCDSEAIERRGIHGWGEIVNRPPPTHIAPYTETFYKPYHWATGSGDIAPVELPGHGPYLIDFKTMKGTDFKQQRMPNWTADKWECQVNIYMDWFDLEHAIIVGIQKDSPHEFKEFEFERNQPLIDAIYLKWQIVSECLDEGIEPPEDEEIELPLRGPIAQ